MRRKISSDEMRAWRDRWIGQGLAAALQVEGMSGKYLVLATDLPLIESLEAGKVPRSWKPLENTTLDEVTLLAPLDIVSARGRALKLFDFEYLWEVYKPVHQRRWGYYTLPILYGDELVARIDPKLDRPSRTLQIKGFWHEDGALLKAPAFASAFANGLLSFAEFLGAQRINISGVAEPGLRKELKRIIGQALPVETKAIV